MGKLEGKVAVVTGAASGLGRASALRFAKEGAAVVVADLNSQGGELVVSEIAAAGGRDVEALSVVFVHDDRKKGRHYKIDAAALRLVELTPKLG